AARAADRAGLLDRVGADRGPDPGRRGRRGRTRPVIGFWWWPTSQTACSRQPLFAAVAVSNDEASGPGVGRAFAVPGVEERLCITKALANRHDGHPGQPPESIPPLPL